MACYKTWLTVAVKSSGSSSRSSTISLFVRRPCNTSFSENEGQGRVVLPSSQWADTRRQVSASYLLVPFQSHRLTIQSIPVAILKTYKGPPSFSSPLSGSPIAQPDRAYLRLPRLVEDGLPEAPIVRPKRPPRKISSLIRLPATRSTSPPSSPLLTRQLLLPRPATNSLP
jgi:hypothetical protein